MPRFPNTRRNRKGDLICGAYRRDVPGYLCPDPPEKGKTLCKRCQPRRGHRLAAFLRD